MGEGSLVHKIIHITDLHCEESTSHALMDQAAGMINAENPDIIICTGDFVFRDERSVMKGNHVIAKEFISRLKRKHFYSIPGNHDCYGT